jgi:hypothetical protein
MPTYCISNYSDMCAKLKEAKRQVRIKYPCLVEGSSGWHRAVENRQKRIK